MGGSRRKSVTPQSPSRQAQAHRGSQTCIPDPKLAILGEVCNGQGAHLNGILDSPASDFCVASGARNRNILPLVTVVADLLLFTATAIVVAWQKLTIGRPL
jgi:hypothetical protein